MFENESQVFLWHLPRNLCDQGKWCHASKRFTFLWYLPDVLYHFPTEKYTANDITNQMMSRAHKIHNIGDFQIVKFRFWLRCHVLIGRAFIEKHVTILNV